MLRIFERSNLVPAFSLTKKFWPTQELFVAKSVSLHPHIVTDFYSSLNQKNGIQPRSHRVDPQRVQLGGTYVTNTVRLQALLTSSVTKGECVRVKLVHIHVSLINGTDLINGVRIILNASILYLA